MTIRELMERVTKGEWLRDKASGFKCDVRAANGRKIAVFSGLSRNPESLGNSAYRAECDANATAASLLPELLALAAAVGDEKRWDDARAASFTKESTVEAWVKRNQARVAKLTALAALDAKLKGAK